MLDKMLMSDINHYIGPKTQFENEIALDISQMLHRCYWDAIEMLQKMLKGDIHHQIGLRTHFKNEIILDTSQMFLRC